jgi:hypothetical protein
MTALEGLFKRRDHDWTTPLVNLAGAPLDSMDFAEDLNLAAR